MGELAKRKHPRLNGYDYSAVGAYFLTLCTEGKQHLFSHIAVGRGILDAPRLTLTDYGIRVEETICYLHANKLGIAVEKYVIMPNHIHVILMVSPGAEGGASGMPRPTNAVVPKFVSALKRYTNRVCGQNLWQDSYHDHIIRDQADYLHIWDYIDQNPAKWSEDRYFTVSNQNFQ